jgi:Kef-type K+ transport system membrane component KefB
MKTKKVTLIPDWKKVLRRAWSARLMLLAAIMSGVEIALPFFANAMPRGVFAGLSFAAVSGAFIARFIAQKGLTNGNNK